MGLTLKKKCKERCDLSRKKLSCSHPKVADSYYVEFRVLDDGQTLTLVNGYGQLKRWKVGSLNKKIAQQYEAAIRMRLLNGQEVSPAKRQLRSITFRQWADLYLQLEEVRRLGSYESRKIYVAWLVKFFGDTLLTAITPEDVRRYRAQRVSYQGKPVSIQTINHDHTTLTHMFNVARSEQFKLVTDNPAAHVPKPDPKNERDRIASTDEWFKILATAAPHLKRIMTVAYHVGPRKSELLSLEWADVDLRRREFTLRETKNDDSRTVPMTPAVFAIFKQLERERPKGARQVFLYKGKPITRIGTAFKAACRRAGVANLRFHDFRHTASTNLRRAGVDTTTAMRIVGHKSEWMHRRYNTIEAADLHEAAAKLHVYTNTLITPGENRPETENVSA